MSEDATLDDFASQGESDDDSGEHPRFGVLPDDWEVSEIAKIAEVVGGSTPSTSNKDYWGGGIPWATPTDITALSGNIIFETEDTITKEGLESASTHLLPPNSVLMTSRATIGKCAINTVEMATNQGFKNLVPSGEIEPWYLYYRMLDTAAFLNSLGSGSTFDEVSKTEVQSVDIPIPPISEQLKISTVLYTIDWAIEKTEEIIEKYQSIVSGLTQNIATTGISNTNLTEKKVPMLPERWEIPTHWELEFLENISTLITDGAHQTPTYVEEGVPFLKVENIKQETINWDSVARIPEKEHNDLIKRGNPTKGDVLLSKNGTIGISKVVDWDREFSHFVSLALIRPDKNIILPNYLATLLESQICMRQAEARSKTGTVTNLHLEEIEKLSIPVPPLSEQREILGKISTVENCLNSEIKYRNRLQRLKQGLMQDLLAGTVRTTDTNIEVPEEIAQHG